MYSGWVELLLAVNLIWLAAVTLLLWREHGLIKRLSSLKDGTFESKLERILGQIKAVDNLRQQSVNFIQKVAVKRYNPYQDTGGDQSFSLALLNAEGSGLVITSLHARAGTRVFAKPVDRGQATQSRFSEEEERVVKQALAVE